MISNETSPDGWNTLGPVFRVGALALISVMTLPASALQLPIRDRLLLEDVITSRRTPERLRLRCRILLLAAEGVANSVIAARLGVTRSTVLDWRRRFEEGGLGAVMDEPSTGRGARIAEDRTELIRDLLQAAPPEGAGSWTVRTLAKAAACSPATVQRVLESTGLRVNPRRGDSGLEPGLLMGMVDLVGFYLHSPYHTLAVEVDPLLVGEGSDLPPLSPKPGEPAWLLHLHLRSIEGIRQLDGRSTHYSSSFWGFLSGLRPHRPGNIIWCITDTPLHSDCRAQLESGEPGLRITTLEAGQDWLNAMKASILPMLQMHIRQGRCPSVLASIQALEFFLREDVPDPLQWRNSA